MATAGGASGKPKPSPYSIEELGQQHYLERKKSGYYMTGGGQKGPNPEIERWEKYARDRRERYKTPGGDESGSPSEGIDEYKQYRDEVANIKDDPRTQKWNQFETETFGGRPDKTASIEDLYMSADKHRKSIKDLFIDPKKKKKDITGMGDKGGGGGKKGGGKKSGGQTGGPGNPNTGTGSGSGDVVL